LSFTLATGGITHKFLTGIELGRQETDNFRETGFFDSVALGATSVNVPAGNPRTTLPINWRQGASDADSDGTAKIVALYLQGEIALSPQFLVVAGLRYDNFKVDFMNNRTATGLSSKDDLISPRLALVYKPVESLSTYVSYSLTYQPRAGEQLASLSATNASFDPEEFTNYELGLKWDMTPNLAFSAAVFELERTKVAIPDPTDPTRSILVDGQRNRGFELGLAGNVTDKWSIIAAVASRGCPQSANESRGSANRGRPIESQSRRSWCGSRCFGLRDPSRRCSQGAASSAERAAASAGACHFAVGLGRT
jgi:catecholate siderophore receptor